MLVGNRPPARAMAASTLSTWMALTANFNFQGAFRLLVSLSSAEEAGELPRGGVRRFVLGHATGDDEVAGIAALTRTVDAELVVAGGVSDLAGVRRVREAGAAGIILGEALLSGAIDYTAAREAAA